jgi:hypothetical protein
MRRNSAVLDATFGHAVHSPVLSKINEQRTLPDCRTSDAPDSIRQKQHALHDCPEANKHDQQSQQVRKPSIGRETIDRPKANCPDDDDDQMPIRTEISPME